MGLLMGKFLQFFDRVTAYDTVMAGYYCFTFLFLFKGNRYTFRGGKSVKIILPPF